MTSQLQGAGCAIDLLSGSPQRWESEEGVQEHGAALFHPVISNLKPNDESIAYCWKLSWIKADSNKNFCEDKLHCEHAMRIVTVTMK